MAADPPGARACVARLDGVIKHRPGAAPGAAPVLAGCTLALSRGSLTAIIARRGAGRSTLAAILTGRRLAEAGQVWKAGRVVPLIGHHAGFGVTGSVERDLALRAAGAGADSAAYLRAVAGLLAPALGRSARWMAQPFDALAPPARIGLLHAAGWALPAALYIADGPLLPAQPALARCLRPAVAAARARGGVLWLTAGAREFRRQSPDRILMLEGGQLTPLDDLDAACAWLEGIPQAHDTDARTRATAVREAAGHKRPPRSAIGSGRTPDPAARPRAPLDPIPAARGAPSAKEASTPRDRAPASGTEAHPDAPLTGSAAIPVGHAALGAEDELPLLLLGPPLPRRSDTATGTTTQPARWAAQEAAPGHRCLIAAMRAGALSTGGNGDG